MGYCVRRDPLDAMVESRKRLEAGEYDDVEQPACAYAWRARW